MPRTGGLPRHSVPRKLRGRRQSSKRDSAWTVAFALRAQPMLDAPQYLLYKAGAYIAGQEIQWPPSLEGTVGLA